MKSALKWVAISFLAIALLSACNTDNDKDGNKSDDEPLQVVTSFTLLEDMVQEIGGEFVETYNLVPIGTDPHEYEPLPEDNKAATNADILLYNGVNLEGGEHGWFSKLIEAVGQDEAATFEAGAGIEPLYLTSSDGKTEEINPHIFLDPVNGIQMAKNISKALIQVDPANKETYEKNTEIYLEKLMEIDQEYQDKINDIPEENRVLVTSERAYQYMAKRYGLKEGYIWAIDTEEGGTPEQITSLIKFIKENNPPVLFVESNVDERPMQTISNETGIKIFPDKIYADELGSPGSYGDIYVTWLKYNIDKIYEGLSAE